MPIYLLRARRRSTALQGGIAALEAALGFAILGSVLAVAIPTFFRDLRSSRFAEPTEGLSALGEAAVAYAASRSVGEAFPASASLTPLHPPRGVLVVDPPGTWQTPTWQALGFPLPRASGRAFSEGQPHAFSFAFDSTLSRTRSGFVAHAHGDLDGNGVTSTFEIRGHDIEGDPAGATVEPGLYVEDRLE
jgi:hypothetical protein